MSTLAKGGVTEARRCFKFREEQKAYISVWYSVDAMERLFLALRRRKRFFILQKLITEKYYKLTEHEAIEWFSSNQIQVTL